ncbi:MAG: tRNA 2-thiouridine(34) synthase MnmA [Chloroflexi bacterium]|nr:tRNA 2-thiouridine(34) synthase MnmA [Chloroflexota bacterium]
MNRIVVAMSGGVDSSVTAALLKDQGYDVIGITMQIWPYDHTEDNTQNACCGLNEISDAKKVAYLLGIPHYVVDLRTEFIKVVVDNFCQEYLKARTPNPCIKCNQYIKFHYLIERAKELGADYLATGHYAKVEYDNSSNKYLLKKGIDPRKDQSYFLYTLNQEQLRRIIMPLGMLSKSEVRQIALLKNMPVAKKHESQEICFISGEKYPSFLTRYIPEACKPGPIVDLEGNILGKHKGIGFYTIGQRKGLEVSSKTPFYVLKMDANNNSIIIGKKEDIYTDELIAGNLNWISIEGLEHALKVKAKIRYAHKEAEASIKMIDIDTLYVKFSSRQMAITPGQSVVFYDDDVVIGGGIIKDK